MATYYAWFLDHALDLLLAAGLVVALVAALLAVVYGFGLMVRIMHWAGQWRLRTLQQAQAAQGITLEMNHRARQYQDAGKADELGRLRSEAQTTARQVADLRKLHQSQDEVLAARATRITALEADLAQANEAIRDAVTEGVRHQEAAGAAQQELATLGAAKEQLAGDLVQRDQVIRMLEGQLATKQKSADMAHAGLSDHKVQVDLLRVQLKSAEERLELLQRIQEGNRDRQASDEDALARLGTAGALAPPPRAP